jgi:hypothetical protein
MMGSKLARNKSMEKDTQTEEMLLLTAHHRLQLGATSKAVRNDGGLKWGKLLRYPLDPHRCSGAQDLWPWQTD